MADCEVAEAMDISKLKVPDLKKELKARGLSTAGNKNELLERLQGALKSKLSDVTADSVDDLEEDLLNDDDDEHLDTSESVIQELDSAMEVASSVVHKRKAEDKDSIIEHTKGSAPKKIVLNRTPSTSSENNQNGSLNSATVSKLDTDSDKKVIKLSELSSKERLEMRAKKFGVQLSVDAKKSARSERFGSNSVNSIGVAPTNSTANIDVLQKRAERFGTAASPALSKFENMERLEKRKQRFGGGPESNGSVSQSEKAKQRLERFKEPAK